MKQFVLKKSGNEFDDESKKYERINDKLNELYEKLQGDVSEEESDAIIEEFQNLIKNCGAAFELRVIPGLDSPVVTGEFKAGALIFGITTNMKPDLITECFKACTQAFSKELERQINMNKIDHQIHWSGGNINMESKCYYEKLDLSEEESQKRNCEIHEIINRFKTLESDMANTTNILEKVRLNSEFIKYLESLGPAYELSVSATQNIDAQANPSVVALGLVNGLTADQLGKCFENAVNAFNTTLENEFRAYQAFNKLKGEHNVN